MRNRGKRLALALLATVLTLGLVSLVWAMEAPSSEAEEGAMRDCPRAGKWAIAVWDGDDGTDADQALASCGEGAVAAAYSIDPNTQMWSRWFAGMSELSTLAVLDNAQGIIALGGTGATPAPPAGASPSPTVTPTPAPSPPASATPTVTPTAAEVLAAGPPTDLLQTFHATLDALMDMDSLQMDLGSEGDFEAPDSCSCDIRATVLGIPVMERRLIVIGNQAWIDTGDGWRETTPSDPEVVGALAMCPACPSFWEGYPSELALPPGEHETKNGVPAAHYSLAELYEVFAGLGLIPEELEAVSVETFDVWLAEDGYWPVSLDAVMCVDAAALEELGTLLGEAESVCMELTIDITRVNDPTIQVNAPT